MKSLSIIAKMFCHWNERCKLAGQPIRGVHLLASLRHWLHWYDWRLAAFTALFGKYSHLEQKVNRVKLRNCLRQLFMITIWQRYADRKYVCLFLPLHTPPSPPTPHLLQVRISILDRAEMYVSLYWCVFPLGFNWAPKLHKLSTFHFPLIKDQKVLRFS